MATGTITDIETAKNVKIVNTAAIDVSVSGAGSVNSDPLYIVEAGAEVHTANTAAPAANIQAEVTYSAVAGSRHQFDFIAWSYDAAPTGGNLTVHNGGGNTYFEIDITAAGPGFLPFAPEMSAIGSALYVTLTAGGAAVSGKVNVMGHRII